MRKMFQNLFYPENQVHKFQNRFSQNAIFLQLNSKYLNFAILAHFGLLFRKKCLSNYRLQHTCVSQNSHSPSYGPFSWCASHIIFLFFLFDNDNRRTKLFKVAL